MGEVLLGRVFADGKSPENNRHLKRKIEYPVLRYGWIDHGELGNIVERIRKNMQTSEFTKRLGQPE